MAPSPARARRIQHHGPDHRRRRPRLWRGRSGGGANGASATAAAQPGATPAPSPSPASDSGGPSPVPGPGLGAADPGARAAPAARPGGVRRGAPPPLPSPPRKGTVARPRRSPEVLRHGVAARPQSSPAALRHGAAPGPGRTSPLLYAGNSHARRRQWATTGVGEVGRRSPTAIRVTGLYVLVACWIWLALKCVKKCVEGKKLKVGSDKCPLNIVIGQFTQVVKATGNRYRSLSDAMSFLLVASGPSEMNKGEGEKKINGDRNSSVDVDFYFRLLGRRKALKTQLHLVQLMYGLHIVRKASDARKGSLKKIGRQPYTVGFPCIYLGSFLLCIACCFVKVPITLECCSVMSCYKHLRLIACIFFIIMMC
ncbi:hypothetical protein U9M48_032020 [Paspalum notatum var. saurae]|uniref:Uncharacterized protein n=1 Tax=Paspalum notatum var. saurae TaxID=547442 RepID=A0AAQ3U4I2_PASNO